MPQYTIELCDGLMCVMDDDGIGYDCHELRSLPDAQRQLRRWRLEGYEFDHAAAEREIEEFFGDQ